MLVSDLQSYSVSAHNLYVHLGVLIIVCKDLLLVINCSHDDCYKNCIAILLFPFYSVLFFM